MTLIKRSADMSTAEFRCWREFLGLPVAWIANALAITPDTIKRWERADGDVNRYAGLMMRHWVNDSAMVVNKLTVALSKQPIKAPMEGTKGLDMPPSWHRMISARVAERTGQVIEWHE